MSLLADHSVSVIIPTSHFDHPGRIPLASSASLIRRAKRLDVLAAGLPMAAADRYAKVLTHSDIATLKHLADIGMGANMLRALASDLTYLEAWC
ncbi:hypothetical protein [Microvirga aerilata]|uniref:hypothetical protein n=1 Tax=Microvirga aerilata TaxID=670292 RepID=UPI0028AB25FB|nr:hypothetical protein [Microvirga aerilata]